MAGPIIRPAQGEGFNPSVQWQFPVPQTTTAAPGAPGSAVAPITPAQPAPAAPPAPAGNPLDQWESELLQADRVARLQQYQAQLRGSAPVKVKGGDFVRGYTAQVAPKMSEETKADTLSNLQQQAEQADVATGGKLLALDESVRQKAVEARQALSALDTERQRSDQVQGEIDRRLQRSRELQAQAADVIVQSPAEFWQSQGTGAKALALLALGLESFGAGLQGRSGTLADRMGKMVDDEIAAQQRRKAELGAQAAAVESSVDRYASMYGTPEARRAAVKAAVLEASLKQYDALAAQAGRTAAEADIMAQRDAFKQAILAERANIERAEQDQVVEQHEVTQDRWVGGAAPKPLTKEQREALGTTEGGVPVEGDLRKEGRLVADPETGTYLWAANNSQVQGAEAVLSNAPQVRRDATEILRIIQDSKGKAYQSSAEENKIKARFDLLAGRLSQVLGQGAMSDPERQAKLDYIAKMGASWTKRSLDEREAGLRQIMGWSNEVESGVRGRLAETGIKYTPASRKLDLQPENPQQ